MNLVSCDEVEERLLRLLVEVLRLDETLKPMFHVGQLLCWYVFCLLVFEIVGMKAD